MHSLLKRLVLIPLVCATNLSHSAETAVAPPNLVVVFPDQMRGQAMGFLGEEPVVTPRLDRFAAESLVLPEAVSNYPVCSPYRAMLMTGKYPHANKVIMNSNTKGAKFDSELQESDRCWSDVLKDKGYSMGYIGKWHLESPHKPYVKSANNAEDFAWNEWTPPHRRHGFDFWYAYNTLDTHMTPEYWATDMTRDERARPKQWGPEHEADLAIRYIENADGVYRKPDQPFAMVVSMNPPHMPYGAYPKKYAEAYKDQSLDDLCRRPSIPDAEERWGKYYRKNIRDYFSMITGVDEQFGRILDALDENGLAENTIVLFTSDHWDCLGMHDMISKNNHYEESMRVPFLIRWPGHIKPGQDDLLLSVPDVYPTLLDLMGFGDAIPAGVQGESHASIFRGRDGPRPESALYMWIPDGQPEWGRRGVRTHRYTLMISHMPGEPMQTVLHDNEKDPYQLENIAETHPEIVEKLTEEELVPWLRKNADPWVGLPDPKPET